MSIANNNSENIAYGLAGAVFAYLVWGVQAVYWKLFTDIDPLSVIAHRYLWSLVFLLILVYVAKKQRELYETSAILIKNPKTLLLFSAATLFGLVNWGITIVAPIAGHVVELGLGLFLTPLMSMAFGVILFRETLTPMKRISITLATIGFLILVIRFGSFPWVAFSVSFTWAVYGAIKKMIALEPTTGVLLESVITLPLTLGYLIWLECSGAGNFSILSPDCITLALIGTGIVSSVPLIAFMFAANNLPLTLLGFCQYISPILTLFIGIFLYHEKFGSDEIFSMTFVWAAIILFSVSEISTRKNQKKSCMPTEKYNLAGNHPLS